MEIAAPLSGGKNENRRYFFIKEVIGRKAIHKDFLVELFSLANISDFSDKKLNFFRTKLNIYFNNLKF